MATQCQPGPAGCQALSRAKNQQNSAQTQTHGVVQLQGTFKTLNFIIFIMYNIVL